MAKLSRKLLKAIITTIDFDYTKLWVREGIKKNFIDQNPDYRSRRQVTKALLSIKEEQKLLEIMGLK